MGMIELDDKVMALVEAATETSGLTAAEVVRVAVAATFPSPRDLGRGGGAADAEVAGDGPAADLD
jgi:hypothetical protein